MAVDNLLRKGGTVGMAWVSCLTALQMRFPVLTLGSGFFLAGAFLLRWLPIVAILQCCSVAENDGMELKDDEVREGSRSR